MVLFCCLVLLSAVSSVYAGLAVNPTRAEVVLKSGDSYEFAYNVSSDFSVPVDIRVETKDWFVLPANKEKGISVSGWLAVSTNSIHLLPGEGRDLQYKVTVPKGARGTLVGMISFVTASPDTRDVNIAISVPVYVTVAGTEKIDWQIENTEFNLNGKKLVVSCSVKNNGNIHLRPRGFVELMSGKNKVEKFGFIEGRPVYPGSARSINASSNGDIKDGNYGIVLHISCAGQEKTIEKEAKVSEGVVKVLK